MPQLNRILSTLSATLYSDTFLFLDDFHLVDPCITTGTAEHLAWVRQGCAGVAEGSWVTDAVAEL